MDLGKKKVIAICAGVFVLGIIVGALAFFGFSKFNESAKPAENSTEQVQEANQEEQKNDKKSSEDSKKTDESEKKSDSTSNNSEVYIVTENNGYKYMDILTFNGEKLLKLVMEVTSFEGKSLDSVKKIYEDAGYKTLEYNKDILKMESGKFTIDSLNKVGSKRGIIDFRLYD